MIGERIRELRERNGMTQTVLARRLGLSRSAINNWEMGISVPSTQYIVELSRFFKVSTDFILGQDKKELVDISFLNPDEKEMIYALVEYFNRYRHAVSFLQKLGHLAPGQEFNEVLDIDFDHSKALNTQKGLSIAAATESLNLITIQQ